MWWGEGGRKGTEVYGVVKGKGGVYCLNWVGGATIKSQQTGTKQYYTLPLVKIYIMVLAYWSPSFKNSLIIIIIIIWKYLYNNKPIQGQSAQQTQPTSHTHTHTRSSKSSLKREVLTLVRDSCTWKYQWERFQWPYKRGGLSLRGSLASGIPLYCTSWYSLFVRALDSWSQGCAFESQQERQENFLLQS